MLNLSVRPSAHYSTYMRGGREAGGVSTQKRRPSVRPSVTYTSRPSEGRTLIMIVVGGWVPSDRPTDRRLDSQCVNQGTHNGYPTKNIRTQHQLWSGFVRLPSLETKFDIFGTPRIGTDTQLRASALSHLGQICARICILGTTTERVTERASERCEDAPSDGRKRRRRRGGRAANESARVYQDGRLHIEFTVFSGCQRIRPSASVRAVYPIHFEGRAHTKKKKKQFRLSEAGGRQLTFL